MPDEAVVAVPAPPNMLVALAGAVTLGVDVPAGVEPNKLVPVVVFVGAGVGCGVLEELAGPKLKAALGALKLKAGTADVLLSDVAGFWELGPAKRLDPPAGAAVVGALKGVEAPLGALPPKSPPACVVAGLGIESAGFWPNRPPAEGWADPKRPIPAGFPPALLSEGGGPAGVVEFPKLNKPPGFVVAGVVDPTGAEVEGVIEPKGEDPEV